MEEALSISFRYKDSRSDKDYNIHLRKKDSGWIVAYEFGKHGQTLTSGLETQEPVAYDKAKAIYDKAIKKRVSRGYTLAESGIPYQDTDKAGQVSGLAPQLLNDAEEEEVDVLIEDDNWLMQEKKDGTRMMARVSADGVVECINRKGLIVSRSSTIVLDLRTVANNRELELDGECIGDTYEVFDILRLGRRNLRNEACSERLRTLYEDFLETPDPEHIRLINTWATPKGKRREYERLKSAGAEGVVFKRRESLYISGRPNSKGDQLRYKFRSRASCLVSKRNDRRSVALTLLGNDGYVPVGNVTIPPNKEVPAADQVIEVRYLYAYPGGSLYQPVYLGVRDDKDAPDYYSSLKFKAGSEDQDES